MVIVGAGMAGARAVIGLREHGWQGAITLVGEEALPPYDRPPLSKAAITDAEEPKPVVLLDDGQLKSLNATFIRGNGAVAIDRAARTVTLRDGSVIAYEKLLLATGAKPRQLNLPGAEQARLLRDFGDSESLRAQFTEGRRIAIIGGGFIGLELAASARKRGCEVTVVEALPRILSRAVPAEIAEVVHRRHAAAGVAILTATAVASLSATSVVLQDGRAIPADVIIAGIGAVPETTLAATAGLAIDNGIACDDELRTSDPDIFAIGDCCSFAHRQIGGKRLRLEAWRNAQDQAAVAAHNMLGGHQHHAAIPWFWSDQYDLTLQIAGFPGDGVETVRRELRADAFIIFHRDAAGRLVGASGIGPGNSIARDIRLAEMLIAKGASPAAPDLADPGIALKSLLKG
jgi:3-phenylpropionate/trans-cinnamate dioxygenase ferredoxin reductase subunit